MEYDDQYEFGGITVDTETLGSWDFGWLLAFSARYYTWAEEEDGGYEETGTGLAFMPAVNKDKGVLLASYAGGFSAVGPSLMATLPPAGDADMPEYPFGGSLTGLAYNLVRGNSSSPEVPAFLAAVAEAAEGRTEKFRGMPSDERVAAWAREVLGEAAVSRDNDRYRSTVVTVPLDVLPAFREDFNAFVADEFDRPMRIELRDIAGSMAVLVLRSPWA